MVAKSQTGLDKNTSSALAYVLGPITGIVFLVVEKDKKVRFHAMQSIVVFGGLFVIQTLMAVSVVLIPFVPLINIVGFALYLLLIYKAWSGEDWEVPFFGKYAKKFLGKV